ncbi:tautomerase family protein [Gallaecimonas mangrovi]|uniref:tautomerase family protein n=1 Tax=Gallaecimonas mangrovi TaxID=2291597 RepID=UPI000E208A31|nr:tautomerase family protein [Gallaecimonas mangrovi]
MPFTRIISPQGRSESELERISEVLHQALVSHFDVPEKDRFQVIEQPPKNHLLFDADYLSEKPRSAQQLLFQITAGKPRSDATREGFYQELTKQLAATVGQRPEDVMVIITSNSASEWSFSGGLSLPAALASKVSA